VDLVIKYQLAESLNLFKLDFYNDWVHGSLFSLFSIRKKLKRKIRMVKKNFVSTSVMMVISHR
jgi:hypothetical protein